MTMVGGWKKNFLRRKQQADQLIGRAEKSEVISNDLQDLEKRAETIKSVCKTTRTKLGEFTRVSDGEFEKRLKKMPDYGLSQSMIESAMSLTHETLLGQVFNLCGMTAETIAKDHVDMLIEVENHIYKPLQDIENEVKAINANKKHLKDATLDMDAAKTRYQNIIRQTQSTGNPKLDTMKDEVDEASQKVEQARDLFVTDLYNFIAKEPEHSKLLLQFAKILQEYHQKALNRLTELIPRLEENVETTPSGKVYGVPLTEHLHRTNKDIALVLEECIAALYDLGLDEEGLFRIAGGAAKVKKLKAALDCGMVDLSESGEYGRDVHSIAGALKQYLRELPEPLMTYHLYNDWMAAASYQGEQRLKHLWTVLHNMPKGHYDNLRYLIKFLAKLSENHSVNKMTPSNIAIVIGPNLIWPEGEGGPSVLTTGTQSAIIEALISNADYFFPGDVDFHKAGRGRGVEGQRSGPTACILGQAQQPRSSHSINSAMTMAHNTLMAPMSNASSSAPVSRESSPSLNNGPSSDTAPSKSQNSSSSSPRDSKSNSASPPSHPSSLRSSIVSQEVTPSPRLSNKDIRERFLESSTAGAPAPGTSAPDPNVSRSEWQRRSWSERPSPLSTAHTYNGAMTIDRHKKDKSDTFSDPGMLGSSTLGRSSARRSLLERATTPPPKPPPPRSMHTDVYNTVFALQSLGDGWTDYLTRVRSLLDNSLSNKTAESEGQGSEAGGSESVPSEPTTSEPVASELLASSEPDKKEGTSVSAAVAGAGLRLGASDPPQEIDFTAHHRESPDVSSSNGDHQNHMTSSQLLSTSTSPASMTGSQYGSMTGSQYGSMTGSQYGVGMSQSLIHPPTVSTQLSTGTPAPVSPSALSSQYSPNAMTTSMTTSMYGGSLTAQQPSPTHRRTPSSPTGSLHSLNEGSGGGTLRRGKKPAPPPPERPLGPAPPPPDKTVTTTVANSQDTPEITLSTSVDAKLAERPPIPERPQVPPPYPPADKPSVPDKPAIHTERPRVPPPERPPVPSERPEKPTLPSERPEKPTVPSERPEKPTVPSERPEKPTVPSKPETKTDTADPDIVAHVTKPETSTKPDILNKPDVLAGKPEVVPKPDIVTKPDVIKADIVSKSEVTKSDGAKTKDKTERVEMRPERPEVPPQPFQRTSSGRPARPGPPPPPPPGERRSSQEPRAPLAQAEAEDATEDAVNVPNSATELTRL